MQLKLEYIWSLLYIIPPTEFNTNNVYYVASLQEDNTSKYGNSPSIAVIAEILSNCIVI